MSKLSNWLTKYEELVLEEFPELAGRIDWDTAIYLYNTGYTPKVAALRTINRLKEN